MNIEQTLSKLIIYIYYKDYLRALVILENRS